MDRLERILAMLDRTLSSKKKRHIAGGILLSVSMLFWGISIHGHDIKHDGEEEKESKNEQRFIE